MTNTKSREFLQGYNACAVGISKPHNPYAAIPDDTQEGIELYQKYMDWRNGWETRFFGEKLDLSNS